MIAIQTPAMGYVFLYGFCRLLAFLPLNMLYLLSDLILYPLVYYLAGYRKKVVRTNLAASFPDKSDKERHSIEKDFYRHFCSVIVETIYLAGISTEEAKRRTSFINGELLEKYLDRGQSVLVYLGHYGNWEYQTFLTLHYPGIHLINVYRPLTSKAFDRLMFKIRDRFDAELLEKQAVLRKMVSLRQQGQAAVFGMIADQSPSKTNLHYWTTFLNQDTSVLTGVFVMSNCYVGPSAHIGLCCMLMANSLVAHDTRVGPLCHFSAGSITGSYNTIGKCSSIAYGTVVLEKKNIGNFAVAGASSLVTKDIPDGEIHIGIPARFMKKVAEA